MALLGRNEPCYCDSGKKYKKCCLKYDEEKIRKGEPLGLGEELHDSPISQHEASPGIKEFALTFIEQLNIWLSGKHISPANIKRNSLILQGLASSDDMEEYYINQFRKSLQNDNIPHFQQGLKFIRSRIKTAPSLTENERTVIRTIATSFMLEFAVLGSAQKADYIAMRVMSEFCYFAIKQGIPDDKYINSVSFYVDSDEENTEKLINWEFGYSDSEEPMNQIGMEWVPLDELNNKYQIIVHSLHGLEKDSKKELATAMYQEISLPYKSRELISYRGLVSVYTSILEKELKSLIELKENQILHDFMMKRINKYIFENTIPILSESIPNLYGRLEEIRFIRNRASHGEEVSHDDFIKVKRLVINEQLFEYISRAKIAYEDEDEN